MKLTISQSLLNKALQTCSKATGDFIPASQCFRLKSDGQLEISCCNNEFSISTQLDTGCPDAFDILLDANKLKSWIASIAEQPVTLDIGKTSVTISAGKANCSLPFEPGENMPTIKHDSEGKFTLPFEDLTEALFKTAYARKVDNGLGDLRCGLSVEFEKNGTYFFATNGDRMATYFLDKKIKTENIIIPYNFVNLLNGLALQGDAKFSVSKNSMQISCDGYVITGALMGGRYFDWKVAVPKYETYIELSKAELLSSIKRLLILSDKFTQKIIFDLSPLGISISASDMNYSQSANEDLAGVYSGSQMKIGFNGQYIFDIVSRSEGEMLTFLFGSNMQPGLFKSDIGSFDFAAVGAMEI